VEKNRSLVPVERIERRILFVRGHRVMLDTDLAKLYGVKTWRLNQQVKRNQERFPEDFVFQLTKDEASALRLQTATSKSGRGGRRYAPYAFTEHGAIMAANVLRSARAIQASVMVVRAFVRLREVLSTHKELAHKLAELERTVQDGFTKQGQQIKILFAAIRNLMAPPKKPRRQIGFQSDKRT
jgi:phage regulator Rha-like protein